MKRILLILCALMAMVACQKSDEVPSVDNMTDSAIEGVCIVDNWISYIDYKVRFNTITQDITGNPPGKGDPRADLIFSKDGECRQCYHIVPAPGYIYKALYTTLNWEIDYETNSIILTDPELQKQGYESATTRLKLLSFKNNRFILEGVTPSKHTYKDGTYYRLYGRIGTAEERAKYLKTYLDERIYGPLNDAAYEEWQRENGYIE